MPSTTTILAIDDDAFTQKVIGRAFDGEPFELAFASSGQEGIDKANGDRPDIILLDIEMPEMNGYEVCEHIKADSELRSIPVVFLSSHGDLRSRMQGYEAGAQDFLVKPFEQPDLIAKMRMMCQFIENQKALADSAQTAQKVAYEALNTSSDMGLAMRFIEDTYSYRNYAELAQALIVTLAQYQLETVLMLLEDGDPSWYTSGQPVAPLEQEMMGLSERNQRFTDFGARTIVHYQNLSLLVKNMPLDDPERYGRIKDLVPVLLSAADVKINSIRAEQVTEAQSREVLDTFGVIRSQLFHLAKTLIDNQAESNRVLEAMVTELNTDFLRMGLEEDQEAYLIGQLDASIEAAGERLDSRAMLHHVFSGIVDNLKHIAQQQEELHQMFAANNAEPDLIEEDPDEGIDLF
ncbi:MAG: response regulator [Pseudomonadota bacterium]